MKITILGSYYNRPKLLKKSIESLLRADYYHSDWEYFLCDDGSDYPGRLVVEDVLEGKRMAHKVHFLDTNMGIEEKLVNGIVIGEYANRILEQCTGEVAITLADDDELVDTHLRDLSKYFTENPENMYCWSKVHIFNPLLQSTFKLNNVVGDFNKWEGSLNPTNKLDTSQVAYRVSCAKLHGVRYPVNTKIDEQPALGNIDAGFFDSLWNKFGDCPYSGLISQYKGIHDYQMVWHKKKSTHEFRRYLKSLQENAWKRF